MLWLPLLRRVIQLTFHLHSLDWKRAQQSIITPEWCPSVSRTLRHALLLASLFYKCILLTYAHLFDYSVTHKSIVCRYTHTHTRAVWDNIFSLSLQCVSKTMIRYKNNASWVPLPRHKFIEVYWFRKVEGMIYFKIMLPSLQAIIISTPFYIK